MPVRLSLKARLALQREIALKTEINVARLIRDESAATIKKAGQRVANILETYEHSVSGAQERLKANERLAELMRTAVLDAYKTNVLTHAIPSYREGAGRLPGTLLTALESPTMAVGTTRGVTFVDAALLDSTARHWARLNFGAGPAEGSLPIPPARVRFGSNQGFSLFFDNPPRPNFEVPSSPAGVGYFLPDGEFHIGRGRGEVVRIHRRPSTHGIGARRFLDAGLVAFANNFGTVYDQVIQDAKRKALAAGR